MELELLFTFSLTWVVVIYSFHSIRAGSFLKLKPARIFHYITTLILLGVFGEVLLDSIYSLFFGQTLWQYHLYPIHNGYTSYYSVFLWGLYGFYLYLSQQGYAKKATTRNYFLVLVIAVEAIILEFILNLSHVWLFGGYIFYYLPNDLWHLTTIQVIPFYFVAALFTLNLLEATKRRPLFCGLVNLVLVSVLIFFTN